MKHKHYDMIVAKAANMDLVVFYLDSEDSSWLECSFEMLVNQDVPTDFFLCLPQHNENGQCLHWLNGGDIKWWDFTERKVIYEPTYSDEYLWSPSRIFMSKHYRTEIFIKPRKEKHWVAIYNGVIADKIMTCKKSLQNYIESNDKYEYCAPEAWQYFEIDVEV